MDTQTNVTESHNIGLLTSSFILAFIAGVIGAVLVLKMYPSFVATPAQTQVAQNIQTAPVLSQDTRVLSGVVTALEGNRITIALQGAPKGQEASFKREIAVDNKTKFTQTMQKDQKALDAEMQDFVKNVTESKKTPRLVLQPEQFSRTNSTASMLHIGDFVTVTLLGGAGGVSAIADEVEFHAPLLKLPVF